MSKKDRISKYIGNWKRACSQFCQTESNVKNEIHDPSDLFRRCGCIFVIGTARYARLLRKICRKLCRFQRITGQIIKWRMLLMRLSCKRSGYRQQKQRFLCSSGNSGILLQIFRGKPAVRRDSSATAAVPGAAWQIGTMPCGTYNRWMK